MSRIEKYKIVRFRGETIRLNFPAASGTIYTNTTLELRLWQDVRVYNTVDIINIWSADRVLYQPDILKSSAASPATITIESPTSASCVIASDETKSMFVNELGYCVLNGVLVQTLANGEPYVLSELELILKP